MGITCKQATTLILKKEEGKITIRQRFQLWKHLIVCRLCTLFYKQNRVINQVLKESGKTGQYQLNELEKEAITGMLLEEDRKG